METGRKSLKLDGTTMAIIAKQKPLMLRDYLRDDFSSCSSSGFRSFPRKQCCTTTTIRLLLEIELKSPKPSSSSNMVIKRSRSKAASATISALHRASVKFVNAVKLLPLPSIRSPLVQSSGVKRGWSFPRTFSLKLSKGSFWKKQSVREEKESNNENEIKRWRLFREFLEEKEQDDPPLDQNTSRSTLSHRFLSSSSSSKRNSCSWGSNEFTSESLSSSSTSNSESSSHENNVVVVVEKKQEKIGVSEREGVTAGDEEESSTEVTTPSSKVNWPNEVKELFSPVSVLDCPFKDNEEISLGGSPPCVEGTKPKLMSKFSLLERFDLLEPMNLNKRHDGSNEDEEVNEIISVIVGELLSAAKKSNPSCNYKVVNLLSDFFIEKLEDSNAIIGENRRVLDKINRDYLLIVAEDWFNGHPQELFLGWEVENGRKVYLRDMEKGKKWKNLNEELEEVALDLEVEIWASLVEEVFVV